MTALVELVVKKWRLVALGMMLVGMIASGGERGDKRVGVGDGVQVRKEEYFDWLKVDPELLKEASVGIGNYTRLLDKQYERLSHSHQTLHRRTLNEIKRFLFGAVRRDPKIIKKELTGASNKLKRKIEDLHETGRKFRRACRQLARIINPTEEGMRKTVEGLKASKAPYFEQAILELTPGVYGVCMVSACMPMPQALLWRNGRVCVPFTPKTKGKDTVEAYREWKNVLQDGRDEWKLEELNITLQQFRALISLLQSHRRLDVENTIDQFEIIDRIFTQGPNFDPTMRPYALRKGKHTLAFVLKNTWNTASEDWIINALVYLSLFRIRPNTPFVYHDKIKPVKEYFDTTFRKSKRYKKFLKRLPPKEVRENVTRELINAYEPLLSNEGSEEKKEDIPASGGPEWGIESERLWDLMNHVRDTIFGDKDRMDATEVERRMREAEKLEKSLEKSRLEAVERNHQQGRGGRIGHPSERPRRKIRREKNVEDFTSSMLQTFMQY